MTNPDFLARLPAAMQERAKEAQERMGLAERALITGLQIFDPSIREFADLTTGALPDGAIHAIVTATASEKYDALRIKLATLVVERGWCRSHYWSVLDAAIEADRHDDNAVASTLAGGLVEAVLRPDPQSDRLEALKRVRNDESLNVLPIALANEFEKHGPI